MPAQPDTAPPPPAPEPPDPARAAAATACRAIVDTEVRALRDRYRRRANSHQLYYRLGGLTTLILGVTLPLLAGLRFSHRDIAISIVSITVAALTGLREFYRWDDMWSLLRRTENALTDALLRWELAISEIIQSVDPAAGPHDCYTATEELLATVRTIRDSETERFFGALRSPRPDRDATQA